jgi:hypothetical protein
VVPHLAQRRRITQSIFRVTTKNLTRSIAFFPPSFCVYV